MRKIIVKVQKEKYEFFMELLNSLDYVQVEEETGDSVEETIDNVKQGLKEIKRYKEGKLKTTSAATALNEPKTKYKFMEQEETDIPAWQIEAVKKRMEAYNNNPEQALDFDEALDDIEKDL